MELIDRNEYEKQTGPLKTRYGLPEIVQYCQKCVISNQRPNSAVEFSHTGESKKKTIHFDEQGVCDACRYAEKKVSIDWDEREKALWELCDAHRSSDGSYDCLLPGSGGKDSFYASHILKYKYKMNPLTVTWAPHLYTDWGWQNFQKWIHSGFDNFLCTPNGLTHRLLTRLAVDTLFHPFQPFMIGQKAFAPKMALKFNIPLIFYGENEAEYGNPIESASTSKRDISFFTAENQEDVCISGVSVSELEKRYKISKNEILPYIPPRPETMEKNKIEVHYLGYYLKWHPQKCYYYAVENGGFQASPERTPGTYSKYNSIDDKIDDLHYYTTFIKFGIGRATYDASQEIRSRDITREEGVALCKRYDGEFPDRFIDELYEYLSVDDKSFPGLAGEFKHPIMTMDSFMELADQFRSPHLWLYKNGNWELRNKVWDAKWASGVSQEEEAVNWDGNRY